MRVLVIGLGSMGKRRVRNLLALGVKEVIGFDVRADRREDAAAKYGISTVDSFEAGVARRPQALIVSLPPDLHVSFARRGLAAGIPFFCEASVVLDGMEDLLADIRRTGLVAFPSCTMRYFRGPRALKAICREGRIGTPLVWHLHSGQYLPDWHPWERIQDYYVSKPSTGGCREIVPFELVWLTDIFGPVDSLSCQKAKLTDIPAPIDDVYQLQLKHGSGVLGQLLVDVISRAPVRIARILGTLGTVEWDADRNLVRLYTTESGAWRNESLDEGTKEKGYINPEEPYVEELSDFLSCVKEGRQPVYSFEEDHVILKTLYAADESAQGAVTVVTSKLLPGGPATAAPALIERTRRFTKSDALRQRATRLIPGGAHTYSKGDDQFPQLSPGFIARGKGARVWDVDGNEFIDWGMGLRAVVLGHAYEPVLEAVREQLELGSNHTRPTLLEGELAEVMTDLIPCAEMVKFAKNGSDVTTAAVKLCRAFTGRDIIVRCQEQPFFSIDDWFIGDTPVNSGIPESTRQLTKRFSYNDLPSLLRVFDEYPDQVAGVIMEPASTEDPKPGFLQDVKALCHEKGAVLILDEMISGLRWHVRGAQHYYGVKPDLATFGKALGNGFSVSALVGRRDLMRLGGLDHDRERVFLLSTTHGGETHALAAAMKTISVMKNENVTDHLWSIGRDLTEGFNGLSAKADLRGRVEMRGLPCSPFMVFLDEKGQVSWELRTLFLQEVIQRGILIPYIAPSYGHSAEDVAVTLAACERALDVVKDALSDGKVRERLIGPACKPVFRRWN